MAFEKEFLEMDRPKDFTANVLKGINRCYEEVTITEVDGECPYGHKKGEKFKVTSMNHDGLCGSLYHNIHPAISSLHYGGGAPWEKDQGIFTGLCPEMGKVQVEVKHLEKNDFKVLKTQSKVRDMTDKGFACLEQYRVFVEILGIERHCTWGLKEGEKFEVDHFNVGKVCGNLYWGAYHFIELLYAGGGLPWELEKDIIHGMCPDIFNQTTFRLIRERR